MNKNFKIILFGFLAWLIPFALSFFFYTKDGRLTINIDLFKSIMVVAGVLSGTFLMAKYFVKIKANFLKEGLIIGLVWFVINVGLDILILMPMSKMTLPDYMMQIGLRYLSIPIMTIGIGYILDRLNKKVSYDSN